MGFKISKSFKSGPVRINLSRKGVGASVGAKGLRVGTGPRGSYVSAARGGLSYRKNLSSGRGRQVRNPADDSGIGCLILIAIASIIFLINFFLKNPILFYLLSTLLLFFIILFIIIKYQNNRKLLKLKTIYDDLFVHCSIPFNTTHASEIRKLKGSLTKNNNKTVKNKIIEIEKDVYNALLDKILDDNFISEKEKKNIKVIESLISINKNDKMIIKKEIFNLYYLEAIEDKKITKEELQTLNNIGSGLHLKAVDLKEEIGIINELLKIQRMKKIPEPLDSVPIKIQKSEKAYYHSKAIVLSRKKSKKNKSGYEFTVKRDGDFVITNKRILVVKDGTTTIKLADIADVDVDLDEKMLIISKHTAVNPTYIKIDKPIICGKVIDLALEMVK